MEVLMRDLYCYECSLQFDSKYVFDVHLSVVHGEKLEIKQEPDSQPSVIPEAKEVQIEHQDEKNTWKNESKRRKGPIKTASGPKGKEKLKCGIYNVNHGEKSTLKKHVTTVHEGKKQFKCSFCEKDFSLKGT